MDPSTLEEEGGNTLLQKHQGTLNHRHNGIFKKNLKPAFLYSYKFVQFHYPHHSKEFLHCMIIQLEPVYFHVKPEKTNQNNTVQQRQGCEVCKLYLSVFQ